MGDCHVILPRRMNLEKRLAFSFQPPAFERHNCWWLEASGW
ncbi:hypothetical protein D779_2868 [Imhoffiella purpurea]|uniref:Uncharacterized protein n=1 Tax=Imhoffiella purpurea TaxID=1249627 RepID=W9VDS5_9GAMM|nr:hypothetical protein D779_2868 [Imhoffiella purpurea]